MLKSSYIETPKLDDLNKFDQEALLESDAEFLLGDS